MKVATFLLSLMIPLSAFAVQLTVLTVPTVETNDPILKERFKSVPVPSSIRDLALKEKEGTLSAQEKDQLAEADQYVKMTLQIKPTCQVRAHNPANQNGSVHISKETPICTAKQIESALYHDSIGISTSLGDSDSSELYYAVDKKTFTETNEKVQAIRNKWGQSK